MKSIKWKIASCTRGIELSFPRSPPFLGPPSSRMQRNNIGPVSISINSNFQKKYHAIYRTTLTKSIILLVKKFTHNAFQHVSCDRRACSRTHRHKSYSLDSQVNDTQQHASLIVAEAALGPWGAPPGGWMCLNSRSGSGYPPCAP